MVAAAAPKQNFESLRTWLNGKGDAAKTAGSLPDLDDDGKPASPGERGSENSADVKKLVPHINVEQGKQNPADGAIDKPVPDSGLMQTSVGKMPEVEKAVKIVTEENEKVSSSSITNDAELASAIASLEKVASAMGIMSTAAAGSAPRQTAPAPSAGTKAPTQVGGTPTASSTAKVAAAGPSPEQQQLVASYVKFGADRATCVGEFLRGQIDAYNRLVKAAEDGTLDASMADPAAAGAAPAAAAAAPPPDAASPPGGGDPNAGGPPSADELASALAEMGVTPDVLMEAAQKLQQMAGGAAPPDAAPAEKAAAMVATAEAVKLASETQSHMRAGQFRLKPAADGSRERARRDVAKTYIDEMLRYAGK